jgi:hypothetical protein
VIGWLFPVFMLRVPETLFIESALAPLNVKSPFEDTAM